MNKRDARKVVNDKVNGLCELLKSPKLTLTQANQLVDDLRTASSAALALKQRIMGLRQTSDFT